MKLKKKALPYLHKMFQGIIFLLGLFLSGCNTHSAIRTIDLDSAVGGINLKLSDLLHDIQVIPLETNDSVLIGDYIKIAVSDKFILTLEREKVCQFGKTGKYLKTLIKRGNGPDEYNTMVNPVVIPGKEILYFKDFKNIHLIYRLDLISGRLLEPVSPGIENFTLYTSDKQGYLYGIPDAGMKMVPGAEDSSSVIAFKFHPDSNNLVLYDGPSYLRSMFGNAMAGNGKLVYASNFNYSDTLFKISGNHLTPRCILLLKNRINNISGSGSELRFLFASGNTLLFEKTDSEITKNKNGSLARNILEKNYIIIDKSNTAKKIKSVYLDPFSYTVYTDHMDFYPFPSLSGETGYITVNAADFKRLHPDSPISENDNPVIITGNIR